MPVTPLSTVPYTAEQDGAVPQLLDVHRSEAAPASAPCVLLWHGSAPDTRFEVAALARETARYGVTVFVPDWRPDAPDGGRAHLMASWRYVRENAASFGADPGRTVVAGWSMGAGAAVAMALRPDLTDGPLPKAVVGIAGLYGRAARSTGSVPLEDLAASPSTGVPVVLVHGAADTIVESRHSLDFHTALVGHRRPVSLYEPATDHAGVVMSAFDPALGHCVPATSPQALRAGRDTARLVARAALD
ncbi:alpha/beta hydrolase fold domain-containing protein [Streptomyces sp. NBC_00442]|uniref:alpha/beta hydrolase n=1 Tax=Streptomyces sp. NBC_00442 TaxID=2903651 RepID=UPI002E201DB7